MDDLVGRALGPYEVMDRIGAGGMATVYRGVHRALGQPRAIKILLPSLAADESLVERFRSEAKIASGLRHPNIVSIYDVGEQDGLFYLVMDLVEGESLGRLLRRQKPLDLGRAMHLLGQLASALDYAHDRGVIHRDIKASNVLIGEDDHVSLFDFGIARAAAALSRLTIPGQVVGTPEYLAPEVITGAEGDCRADFYALGILAYQILAGQLPFAGTDTMALLYAQVSKTPPSLCGIRPELPVAVEQVVMRQLAKAPEARYPTADSFVSALRSATLDASTRGPSTPPGASQPAAPEPWRPGPGGEDPASQTAPGLDDDLTTPLPPSQYRPDEESVTPRPRARPAGFDPSVVTIPPESVYRPEPVHRPEPSRARAESRVPGARSPGGRADLALQRAPAPRPLGPEPSPRRGVGLLSIVVVVLGLVVVWALASGQLDSIVGLGPTPTAAPPTQAPALASTSSGETPSAVMAAPQQIAPPVAASPAAEAVAPPVAVLPPVAASDLTPPPALPPSGQAGQATGPTATPEPTTTPVAQIAALPPPPEQQLALALAKIEGGEHSSALSLLAVLKESAPNTEGLDDALYRAYLGHGQQQFERGLLDESYAAYGEALKVRPDDPVALEGQKQVVLAKLWSTMEAAWDQDDAVASAALEEILALDPGYREASLKLYALLVAQANRLLGAGDVDSALAVLRRAHEVYPEGEEARVLIEAHTPTPTPEAAPAPAPAQNQAPAPAPKPAEQQPPGIRIPMPVPGLPDINVPLPRP